jgi:hypothetical protein
MPSILDRAKTFWDILDRPVPKFLLGCWGIIATWDTFVSQFIPEETAKSFPKAHQVVAMTYGWLPIQTWLAVGAILISLISLEWGARHRWKFEQATGQTQKHFDSNRAILAAFWLAVGITIILIWSLDATHWRASTVKKIESQPIPETAAPPSSQSSPPPTPAPAPAVPVPTPQPRPSPPTHQAWR